ncbi:hypothetical protein [Endozoicomonas sp. SCSIO W0465]|uniref:hypothetical protein n=1 Tax=Endozoicomonas sp. SCSIO W0465 TaxID=2918516 RepID=UPI002074EF06|nr:hypothetical protein [Endozoicomonas sp. SCSIO W0465]USE39366.1 hypothetical protein MJO57_15115 [Endozoicomonas sp. SCSIO W0465]
MNSSDYNFFHSVSTTSASASASDARSKSSETHDDLLQNNLGAAQATVTDSLSKRTAEPRTTDNYMGSSGFSSVFFDARSQEYLYLVKAIDVMEKGSGFNDDKLGSVSREKMTVSQLKKKKNELKIENEIKLRDLERISEKLSVDLKDEHKKVSQQDITSLLEILSDFHSSYHFLRCMFFILQKVMRDHSDDEDEKMSHAVRYECGEIVELIYRIMLSHGELKVVAGFHRWYLTWDMYYLFNVIGCCLNIDSSDGCSSYFSPELPVKVALKSFGRSRDLMRLEKEFLNMKKGRGDCDELMVQPLHFSLLVGKEVHPDVVISRVKSGCLNFLDKDLDDPKNFIQYIGLLQFLHTATVCVLEKSPQDASRLLECYEWFYRLQPSAGVLKQFMQARCEEKSGAVDAARRIYQSLASGQNKVPVFEEWIACLEKMGDNDAIVKACRQAADYYRGKGISWREEFYESKAASNMLLIANRDALEDLDQSPGQDDISSLQPDVETQAIVARSKKHKGKRKNKAKGGLKNQTVYPRNSETINSVQSYPMARPCSARKVKEDTVHDIYSEIMATELPQPGRKTRWNYWRELNGLFSDYYHLPHKYRDVVGCLCREACMHFPNDIWILHSAGWGFHLIGDDKKAAELLLKGLRQYLDYHYPEVKSFIPVTIDGDFEPGLDRLKTHPEIVPGSSAGLNVAAYLSSLAYVYRNINKHYGEQMRSIANWLNPFRDARKKEKQRLSFKPKVNVVATEINQFLRRGMASGHGF